MSYLGTTNQTTFLQPGQLLGTNTVGQHLNTNYSALLTPTALQGEYNTSVDSFPEGEDLSSITGNNELMSINANGIAHNTLRRSYSALDTTVEKDSLSNKVYLMRDTLISYANTRNVSLFKFLSNAVEEDELYAKVMKLIFEFSNTDFDTKKPLPELFTDDSMESTKSWLNEQLGTEKTEGKPRLEVVKDSLDKLVELWVETMKGLRKAEDGLEDKVKRIESVQKSLCVLQLLPLNSTLPPLLDTVKNYIEHEYNEINFKESFDECIMYYKRVLSLQNTMSMLRSLQQTKQENLPICPVCLDKPVNTCLTPCGHTFCDGCTGRDVRFSCPVCRTSIKSKQKLYFN